ncbi:MAG: YhfC family intramembrane metalloprotease [Erysipelotrichaceae bacterium]|nr:YhfC family intramembrane metalloprotease [Erysipelotrichaceae bacterium]
MNDSFVIAVVLVLTICMMLAGVILLHRRFPGSLGIAVAGGLGYFFTQVLLQLPLIPMLDLAQGSSIPMLICVGLFTALLAGGARYLIVRAALSDKLSWGAALSAGIGHGFCETLFLFVGIYFIQLMLMQAGAEVDEQVLDMLFHRPLSFLLIDFTAQISAVCFHIAMYLVIVRGFLKKQETKALLIVCGIQVLHTFFKYYILSADQSIWINGAGVILIGLLSFIYILQTYQAMNKLKQIDFEKDAGETALEEGY